MAHKEHERIAERCSASFERLLVASLPRIDDAMAQAAGQASFSVTVAFREDREGRLLAKVTARERVPIEPEDIRIHRTAGGQLALFDGDDDAGAESAEDLEGDAAAVH